MDKLEIILEHTRLAREFSELPTDAESPEAYAPIQKRRNEIISRIQELREIESTMEGEKDMLLVIPRKTHEMVSIQDTLR